MIAFALEYLLLSLILTNYIMLNLFHLSAQLITYKNIFLGILSDKIPVKTIIAI